MNPTIQIFQTRIGFKELYQHPVIDIINDSEDVLGMELPPAPWMSWVIVGGCSWLTVEGADSYIIQRLSSGTDYEDIATIDDDGQPEMVIATAEVTSPGYYRVRAVNAAGVGPPSAVLDLNVSDNLEPSYSS